MYSSSDDLKYNLNEKAKISGTSVDKYSSIFCTNFRHLHLILQMRTLQLPRLMSRAKEMLHLSLKMRSLRFHTQTWQSWMTWSTGTFTLSAFFPVHVDYLWKHPDSESRICASSIHWIAWKTSCWVRVWKKCSYQVLWAFFFFFWKRSLHQGL